MVDDHCETFGKWRLYLFWQHYALWELLKHHKIPGSQQRWILPPRLRFVVVLSDRTIQKPCGWKKNNQKFQLSWYQTKSSRISVLKNYDDLYWNIPLLMYHSDSYTRWQSRTGNSSHSGTVQLNLLSCVSKTHCILLWLCRANNFWSMWLFFSLLTKCLVGNQMSCLLHLHNTCKKVPSDLWAWPCIVHCLQGILCPALPAYSNATYEL